MDTTKGLFTQRNEVRNSIRRMKYLKLAFSSNSVYISGKPLYAEREIVQLNASPECTALYPQELNNLICKLCYLIILAPIIFCTAEILVKVP